MSQLNFTRINTPPNNGGVLVEPSPPALRAMVEANAELIARWDVCIVDLELGAVRAEVRRRVAAVDGATPIIVTGHQPEFIHPGVWAKHVIAARLVEAVGGTALNLIVDSDHPKQLHLTVPAMREGRLVSAQVAYAEVPAGGTYECIPRLSREAAKRFEGELRSLLADRFEASMLGTYFRAFDEAHDAVDYVDQTVAGRRAVERAFGVEMSERRVSQCWLCPLLVEMLANAGRFHEAYNAALADYRRDQGIRGRQRPVPDLVRDGRRLELPLWVMHAGGARQRLMVEPAGDRLMLLAGQNLFGTLDTTALKSWHTAQEALCELDDVLLRPRALALTLWARMLLADLFIHGIGGAKYDRITDLLIKRYFGVTPPAMACVSATLRLDLPRHDVSPAKVAELQRQLRDLRYNPQRHLSPRPDTAELIQARALALRRSDELRSTRRTRRHDRRAAFNEIRSANDRLLQACPDVLNELERRLRTTREQLRHNEAADRRDHFFALFSPQALEDLCDALPAMETFR